MPLCDILLDYFSDELVLLEHGLATAVTHTESARVKVKGHDSGEGRWQQWLSRGAPSGTLNASLPMQGPGLIAGYPT